ncbi:Beta-galactosidase [Posidoniimonas polymericola]|uniref:Beta-galactosidase n=1 Tax=Posidoniimonas polymericola TaxID=2528002 RepID=A0A5C5YKY8_9BACT|nr:glycoside hydrolase family 2 TIM barrel-domain containing protein [Posidoniimonas polymericola]TWT75542.1 Beta-galactosidase [Posidoniimonas polymericola]
MNRIHGVVALVLLAGAAVAESPREARLFDQGWRFAKGDHAGAEAPDWDDAAWDSVDLPHDWTIAGPFSKDNPAGGEGAFLPTGVCWYRKSFPTPADLGDRRVFVEFDGVMANSDVWINGDPLGHRPNGYVSFRYELTEHLNPAGEQNVLAVRADTSQQVASRWYTGSGVYRHVRLVTVEPVHVAYNGVYITTPQAEAEAATVAYQVAVRNHRHDAQDFVVRATVIGPDGAEAAAAEASGAVPAGTVAEAGGELPLANPRRWSVDAPTLYTLRTEVVVSGKVVDRVETAFGIRKAEFLADSGFWLNGENLKLKGVCLHHAGGALGAAVPPGWWEDRLAKLKELGVNAVRTSHNPVAPEFLDLCDRLGMMVMDEFFDCWEMGKRTHDYHKYFAEWSDRDLRDTLVRDRNHPCIVLYSVGNEIRDTHKEVQAKRILRRLVDTCHEVDPTRPVTQGLFRPNVTHDYDNGLADILDVIGTNYRDSELLQAHVDDPTRKIVGTEQGHDRRTWLECRDNPQHSGQFLWVGIDYLGESRRWPVTTFDLGLIDRTGHTHPRGYERQSWWSDRPMVQAFRRIAPTEKTPTDPGYEVVEWKRRQVLFPDWTPRNQEAHAEQVEVFSNCEEVELLLNGESLAAKKLPRDAGPRAWRVDYKPGELVAVGRTEEGETVKHVLRTAGSAARIELACRQDAIKPGWEQMAVVDARIVDEHGTVLPRAEQEIVFKVSGPAEVVAVDNGSIVSLEPFQSDRRTTFQGRCVAFLQAVGGAGQVTVTADSPGLASGKVRFTVEE